MNAPAPLSKDELKTVTLALRNASDLCEVVGYIGELTPLEALCLGKRLALVKDWLSRIEMLAGWRGELEVNMELFAADVQLVIEACQQRGKLSFETYVVWFAQSGFQTMPRYKGRFRRLFKALEKLRNYTRMVYLEIPDPAPPPSPAPSLVVQPVPEEQSTIETAPEVVNQSALEACQERGKVSLEKYADCFAQPGFQTMPRYKGRFRRLFNAFETLKNYTQMVYREIPDPTPPTPASPAPSLVVQPVAEEQSATEAVPEVTEAGDSQSDVQAAASIAEASTETEDGSRTTAATPLDESEELSQEPKDMDRYYLPEMDQATGWAPWPASEFSEEKLQGLNDARRLWDRAYTLFEHGQAAAAAISAAAAVEAIRPAYDQTTPAGRQSTALFYATCLTDYAGIIKGDDRRQDLHASLWQEATGVVREGLEQDPFDLTLLRCLALLLADAPECFRTERVAVEAVDLLRKLLWMAEARGSEVAEHLIPTLLRNRLAEALLQLGASRFSARPEEAVDAWEEGIHYTRILLQQAELPAWARARSLWHSVELCFHLANAYSEQGKDKEALSKTREGLQSCQRYRSATNNQLPFMTAEALCDLCGTLFPREEKRLIKLVNIRKIQAKTRKQARQVATEEQKAELAAAVAELADLRELQRALKEVLLYDARDARR